jgi:hypothetical protein
LVVWAGKFITSCEYLNNLKFLSLEYLVS